MRTRKRGVENKQYLSSVRLKAWEVLCEECGLVHDVRTGAGLCRYCASDESRDEADRTDRPDK